MTDSATWQRWFPFLGWWPRVTAGSIRLDLSAAFTGALIVLPQAVAFASIAGLPPQYGLYAAMIPAVVAALWGSSWHLVSGPTTAISIVVFASVSPLAPPGSAHYIGLVLTLTLLAGIIQLAMGLARLGALVNFISHTVILGFTAGAAFLIAASQIKNFFGLAVPNGLHFHEVVLFAARHLGESHLWVVLVGTVTLVSGLLSRYFLPRLPYMIVAMVAGSLVAAWFNHMLGASQTNIETVGTLVASFPPFSMPDMSFSTVKAMLFPAAIIAMLALTEAVAIARSIAVKSGQRIDSNQEFIGQGLSNMAGAFFSAYPASGSFNRSGVNFASGAQTPLAAALSAVFLLLIALLAAPLAAYLPVPAMAGVLFIVAWGLIDFQHIGEIIRRHPRERTILAMTFVGTLVDLEKGIFLGVLLSLLFYLYRTSQPNIEERTPLRSELGNPKRKFIDTRTAPALAPACPQVEILRIQGSVYFGAVEHVSHHLHREEETEPHKKWLMLLAQGVNFIDLAGAQLLAREAQRRQGMGGGLFLVGAQATVREMLTRGGQLDEVGPERVIAHKGDALRALYPRLDSEICRACSLRVFEECQTALPNGEPRASPLLRNPETKATTHHE
ncbi:SulP family inorganic anion transporter [Rhodoferax sp.]|uniref:SulP family inorganic anion transporter n=1 Tax=Rhodoferax sp. TaxID=50421 RepID=UPI002768ED5C|nr:SulP family inorganic anion transporter [Rhodoferax sp.]